MVWVVVCDEGDNLCYDVAMLVIFIMWVTVTWVLVCHVGCSL